MTLLQAIILGIVQGLTEFIPVSSSGHLVVLPQLIPNWTVQPLAFDTLLHLGTALALLTFFWKDIVELAKAFFVDLVRFSTKIAKYSQKGKLAIYIVLASIPAAALGYLFEDLIESEFRSVSSVALVLVVGSVFMLYADKVYKNGQSKQVTLKAALSVGLFQVLALFPGFSRSGATISTGMLNGLSRREAARFSFVLSIPIVIGAGLFKVVDSYGDLNSLGVPVMLCGLFSSFLTGFFAIKFMLGYLNKKGLKVFVVYRVVLALVLLIAGLAG